MVGKERITLEPGQLVTSRKSLSEKTKVSESKIERILKLFKNEQQVEQQSYSTNRIITVLNWHKYQESEQQTEQQVNSEWTASEQQVNTNKNIKNLKNKRIKEIKDIGQSTDSPTPKRFIPPTLEDVKGYCQERKNKVDPQKWIDHYTSNGWKVGKNAMKDWKAAVRTWERSEYGKGNADKGRNPKTNGKPQIPTVSGVTAEPISKQELEEYRALARKIDGG